MLRKEFPTTEVEAAVFGGFMLENNFFCRTFEAEGSLEKTLTTINDFLVSNGYDKIHVEELDEEYYCEKDAVSISKHGYQEELVLIIKHDSLVD